MKKIFKRFWPYMRQYKRYFGLALLGTLVAAGATAAVPYLLQPVLDEIFVKKDTTMLYLLPGLIILVHVFKGIGIYTQAYYTSFIGQDIIRRLREELLSTLIRLELNFFQQNRKGSLISRITNDTTRIQSVVSNAIPVLLRDILTIVALLGVVVYRNPTLAFMGLVVLPLAAWPLSILSKRMRRFSKTSQVKVGGMTSRLSEIFHNIEIIKSYNAEDFEQQRFSQDNKDYFRYTIKGVRTNQSISPIMETLGSIGVATVILVGGLQVIEGTMTVGAFFSFTTALFMLYAPVRNASKLYNHMQDAVAAGERIFEFLDLEPQISAGTRPLQEPIREVRLENVHVRFGKTRALDGINLTVSEGERIALVGMSGGGKTTLVNLLPRFIDPTEGRVFINGVDLRDYQLNDLRDQIGMVTQQVFLFHDTIAANVAYGRPLDEERVMEALRQANAWEFVEKMPNGIHEMVGEHGVGLSGGQRQRISIARAIYKNPSLFILDEATSALDNESEARVQEALEHVTAGKITFIIAHRLSTIQGADRIVLMSRGRIVDIGTQEELMENSSDFRQLASGGLAVV